MEEKTNVAISSSLFSADKPEPTLDGIKVSDAMIPTL